MHVTIIALGSRGDVLPCAALGRALRRARHQVRFATFEGFGPTVEAQGLAVHPIRGDAQAIMLTSGGRALAESGQSVARMAAGVMRSFGALANDYARDLTGLAAAETDLIVNQLPGGLYGYDLAEVLDVPMVMAAVMPLVPTCAEPMLAFPPWPSFLPGYNLSSHWVAHQILWQAFRPTINRWRQEMLGLGKARFWGVFAEARQSVTVLNGFSRHVVPRPQDWGEQVHITGYWFPEDETWQPPEDLRRFVECGSPPVFVGFGSMPVRSAKRVTAMVLEALRRSGQRGILHSGWGGIGRDDLPGWAFPVEYVPYGWLFPRTGAVVHHGGSGTTAFGLWAGVPSLVVPFLFDQFYWGRRIAELGVGPQPIPFRKLTLELLTAAIDQMVQGGEMRGRARALGSEIQAEDGLGAAVEVLSDPTAWTSGSTQASSLLEPFQHS